MVDSQRNVDNLKTKIITRMLRNCVRFAKEIFVDMTSSTIEKSEEITLILKALARKKANQP